MKDLKKIFEESVVSLDVHRLVLEYLNHSAYLGTLEAFVQESGINKIEGALAKSKDETGLLKKHARQYCIFSPLFSFYVNK